MFGQEEDAKRLGRQMAQLAAPAFDKIQTQPPQRMSLAQRTIELPLDPPPSVETLDQDIRAVEKFIKSLKTNPKAEWAMRINCVPDWPVQNKINHYKFCRFFIARAYPL